MDSNPISEKNDSYTCHQMLDSSQKGCHIPSKVLDYYDAVGIDDFSLATRGGGARGSCGKSKGGKGRNKREVRKANGGKTCYSSKHVRIHVKKRSKSI